MKRCRSVYQGPVTPGAGGTSHLAGVLMGKAHDVKVEPVFINGAVGLLNAVAAGDIDVVFSLNTGTAGPAVKARSAPAPRAGPRWTRRLRRRRPRGTRRPH